MRRRAGLVALLVAAVMSASCSAPAESNTAPRDQLAGNEKLGGGVVPEGWIVALAVHNPSPESIDVQSIEAVDLPVGLDVTYLGYSRECRVCPKSMSVSADSMRDVRRERDGYSFRLPSRQGTVLFFRLDATPRPSGTPPRCLEVSRLAVLTSTGRQTLQAWDKGWLIALADDGLTTYCMGRDGPRS